MVVVCLEGAEGVVVAGARPRVASVGGWGSPVECDLGYVVGVCVGVSAFGLIVMGVKVEISVRDSMLGLCVIEDRKGVVVSAPHLVGSEDVTRFVVRCVCSPVGV